MQTEDLISRLAGDAPKTPPGSAERRLFVAMGLGLAVAFVAMLLWLGLRADLAEAVRTPMFWVKFVYPATLAVGALILVRRLGDPTGRVSGLWAVLAAPVLTVLALGALQLVLATPDERLAIWLGHSARFCPLRIAALAIPTFLGLLWAFRRMAPTRPALAGAAAGLAAGGVAAAVYSLACGETAPAFLATWYSLGIAICAALGAVLGSRLLRW